jgi:hypothetical protein
VSTADFMSYSPTEKPLAGPFRELEVDIDQGTPLPRPRPELSARILGWISAWLLRIQCTTWRKETEGLDGFDDKLTRGERVLLTFWHGKYIPLFTLLRGRRAFVFTTRSFRGNIIAEICRHFGYHCVQIPDKGTKSSLNLMRQTLATHRAGCLAVDGPLGPYHVVKRRPVQIASELGYALVPASVGSHRKRVLQHRWDRMEVPGLFTRVCLVIGQTIEVPVAVTPHEVRRCTRLLHDALETVDRRADQNASRRKESVS